MAWLRNTNRGRTEPSAEEWRETSHDSQGKKHSVVNYSATLNRQSHIRQTERVFGIRHVTDDPRRLYSPPRIKDHGDVVDDYPQFPRNKAYGLPKKPEEFPPKEHLKGAPMNSAAPMKPSPFSRNDDHSSTDDSDDDDYDRHGEYEGSYSPKMVRTKPERDTDYGRESPKGAGRKPSFVPPAGRRQQYIAPVSTSPKKDTNHETARNRPIGNSPPRSKPETDTQFPKAGWKPLYEPTTGRHPQYSAPVSTSPKKGANHETARNRPIGNSPPRSKPETDTQFPKAGWKPLYEPTTGRHPQYSAPVSTSPKNDMHYETANNRPIRPGLPRIKPETDTVYASDSAKAGGNPSFGSPAGNNTAHDNGKVKTFEIPKPKYAQQPQVSPRAMTEPRKEDPPETIDSSEARKRYGGKAINQPKREVEEHTGTISSIEAVRKYNGILLR